MSALGKILVTAAWPYIQHIFHLGNLLPILSADVIARYHRLRGDNILFVSGSDEHGTPIEVEAIRQGVSPKELTDRNHRLVSSILERWEISFDNYTRTENPVHKDFVRNFFLKIEANGYIFTQEDEMPYCQKCKRYLPDRFIEGKCPYCSYDKARGDQCEQCGRLLDPTKLVDAYCAICGNEPIIRKVTDWYFDLPKFTKQLTEYIENNRQLPDNARNFSLSFLKEGLKPRPITRENKWGIPVPFKGAEDKTLYVWVDAVLGYISATLEYFAKSGDREKWREYWFDKDVKTLYFIGKDNIPFHTLILPALLLATREGYNLPWNVSTNEFLMFEGQKFSKSQGVGIWIDEALEMFPADYWRYTLASTRPEAKDANFTWETFAEKVNSDLNDTLGNLVHRTLTFINSNFNGAVPAPNDIDELDIKILDSIQETLKKVEEALEGFQIQNATREVVELGRIGNKYFNDKKPWKSIKTDPQEAANTLYVSAQLVKALAYLLEPFIPHTAEKLRRLLNLSKAAQWKDAAEQLPPGHKIKEAEPLFYKIKESGKELQEMLEKTRSASEKIPFKKFSKLDIRVGKIVKVERIPQAEKLLKLTIDIGDNQLKTAVAGIAKNYSAGQLEGRQIAVVTNLEPRKLFGVESQVMIMAASDESTVAFLEPEKAVKTGSKIS